MFIPKSLSLTGSSSSSLAGLGALAVVVAVPAAGAKFANPICKFLSKCLEVLRCCSFTWLNAMLLNIRLIICCSFFATWRSRRSSTPILVCPEVEEGGKVGRVECGSMGRVRQFA